MVLLAQMISYATHMGYLILVAKIIYVVVYKADLDHKQEYDKEVLTMGLFYMEFQDTIREGDGHRVTRCLKFLLLWSRSTG